MKTAEEILAEKFEASKEYPLQLCITLNPDKAIILEAMETYANQQLSKERKDKEQMVEMVLKAVGKEFDELHEKLINSTNIDTEAHERDIVSANIATLMEFKIEKVIPAIKRALPPAK